MLSSAGLSRWFWDVWVACGLCRPLTFLSLPHGLTCKDSLHHHFFLKRSREQYFQSLDVPHGAGCCSIISSGMPQSQDGFRYEYKNLCGADLKASRKRLRKTLLKLRGKSRKSTVIMLITACCAGCAFISCGA